jgi:hypothetical protein
MNETDQELRFDRATYSKEAGGGLPCANCRGPLGDSYWKWQQLVVCSQCRDVLAGRLSDSQSSARFAKALLFGCATSLGCGIAYAIFAGATHMRFALATIGIAFLIARVVRHASGGIGGTRYQVAAVALTYFAATMGYIPEIWAGLKEASAEDAKRSATDPEASTEANPSQQSDGDGKAKGSLIAVLVAVAWLVGIMLASPFLTAAESPLGLLIVAFGLWEAWKLSRAPPLHIDGPFHVGANPSSGPSTP